MPIGVAIKRLYSSKLKPSLCKILSFVFSWSKVSHKPGDIDWMLSSTEALFHLILVSNIRFQYRNQWYSFSQFAIAVETNEIN